MVPHHGSTRFDVLESVGFLPSCVTPLPDVREFRYRLDDPLYASLPENLRDVNRFAGPYYRSSPSKSSVYTSIKKCDLSPVKLYKHRPFWTRAKDLVFSKFYERFDSHSSEAMLDEVILRVNLDTSPGAQWLKRGLKKKRSCLNDPTFLERISTDPVEWYPPLWKVAGKTEWSLDVDIDRDKVRTFIIPPFDYLIWQEILYMHQNESLKDIWWSAYGMNPYMGGTDRAARKLLRRGRMFVTYDVSGWDRKLPIMSTIYKLRNHFKRDQIIRVAEWVTKFLIDSYLILPDGVVVRKRCGNNSGSANTTPDNILAHCMILSYTLLTLFDGDESCVLDSVAYIFGDDCVLSLPVLVESDFVERVFRSCFLDFGLALDPFSVTESLEGHEFLGFRFHKLGGSWIPSFKPERLAASFCYAIGAENNVGAQLSKAWSLLVMAAGASRSLFDAMRLCVLEYFSMLKSSHDKVVRSYLDIGVPTYSHCVAFYLGLESSIPHSLVLSLEEVGIKDFYDE